MDINCTARYASFNDKQIYFRKSVSFGIMKVEPIYILNGEKEGERERKGEKSGTGMLGAWISSQHQD